MKPNFLKDKDSNTMVLEREKAQQTSKTEKTSEKQASNSLKVNLFSAKTFEDITVKSEKMNTLTNKKKVFQKPIEPEIKEEKAPIQEKEVNNFVSFKRKPKARKKSWKFRVRLVTVIYAAAVLISVGWVGANAIRISNINSAINGSQIYYARQVEKYARQISNLDDLRNQDPDYDNTDLVPIEEIITVTPLPLEDITEYTAQSNWFDNIVNWFGNIF